MGAGGSPYYKRRRRKKVPNCALGCERSSSAAFSLSLARETVDNRSRMLVWLWALLAAVAAFVLLWLFLRPRRAARAVDQRLNGRIPLTLPVRMRIGDHVLEATASDVSRGGMCLLAAISGSAGQPVELEFALPGQSVMLVYGVVRWKKPESIGILFDPRDRNRAALLEWMAAQQTDSALSASR